jgi:hypothetical protein
MHALLSDKTLRCRMLHSEMMQQATKPSIGFSSCQKQETVTSWI